jgi:hypothetical protein
MLQRLARWFRRSPAEAEIRDYLAALPHYYTEDENADRLSRLSRKVLRRPLRTDAVSTLRGPWTGHATAGRR